MRRARRATPIVFGTLALLVVGCGESGGVFGQTGATGGLTSSSAGSGGTGAGTSSGGTGASTSSGGTGAGTSSGGTGAGTSSGGSGGLGCTPVGHDEDADSVDDACDNCPSYGNQEQVNGDQDGVGDACEAPADAALWSTITSFDAFVTAPGAAWDLGDYVHAPDELEISTPANAGRNADWLTPLTGRYSVETTFAYDGNEAAWAGVRFANDGAAWWACLVERVWEFDGYRYNLGIWEFPGSGTAVLLRAEAQNVGSEPAGLLRRVRAHVGPGGSILCTYDDSDDRHGQVEHQAGNLNGLVGLRAYDTHAHFFNFVVYQ